MNLILQQQTWKCTGPLWKIAIIAYVFASPFSSNSIIKPTKGGLRGITGLSLASPSHKTINMWQLINIPVSGKRHLREKKSFFRESFATPSPRPFVCSVRSGAIVAAAVVLANTVAAVHLRAVRSVKCRQSPSFALATCGCRRCAEPCNKPPGLSPVFRGSFAKLAPK